MSTDSKNTAATVAEMETVGGSEVVSSKSEPTTPAAPVDVPTEVEWMMACNEIVGAGEAEEIITRAYSIAELPRSSPAGPTDVLHAVLRNSTPLREAAFRALGFIDRETAGGENTYRHMQKALHDECESTPAAPGIDLRVRELLARRLRQWRTHLPADPAKPGTRAIRTYDHPGLEGETDYNNDVAIWREACSVLDEALTLIDASPNGGEHFQDRLADTEGRPRPEPEGNEFEEVAACLGDDAAAMLDENPEDERALNMQRAAELLTELQATSPKGGEVQDDRFPRGLPDAIKYADAMQEGAAALYDVVFGHENDGSDTGVEMINAVLRELASSPKGGSDVVRGVTVERMEDMSVRGRLKLYAEEDGDMCLMVVENDGTSAGVEFCASGGRSPRTLEAVRALSRAMEQDNAEHPISRATSAEVGA